MMLLSKGTPKELTGKSVKITGAPDCYEWCGIQQGPENLLQKNQDKGFKWCRPWDDFEVDGTILFEFTVPHCINAYNMINCDYGEKYRDPSTVSDLLILNFYYIGFMYIELTPILTFPLHHFSGKCQVSWLPENGLLFTK